MAEESKGPRPGVSSLLDDLKVEIRKKTISGLAVVILGALGTGGALLLGAIATGIVSLPDPWLQRLEGALALAALALAALLLILAIKNRGGQHRAGPTSAAGGAGVELPEGLQFVFSDTAYGSVFGPWCHIQKLVLRIEQKADGLRFCCRSKVHHCIATLREAAPYAGEPTIRYRKENWVEVWFPNEQVARGAELTVEISSEEGPVSIQEVEVLQPVDRG